MNAPLIPQPVVCPNRLNRLRADMSAAEQGSGPDVDFVTYFGHRLLAKRDGKATEVPVSELDGKYVGIYFSAHW